MNRANPVELKTLPKRRAKPRIQHLNAPEKDAVSAMGGKARWNNLTAKYDKARGAFKSSGDKPLGFARLSPKERHNNAVAAGKKSAAKRLAERAEEEKQEWKTAKRS